VFNNKVEYILFDLDGTLIDSAPDIAAAVNATLVDIGKEEYPLSMIKTWIGNGAKTLLKRALTGSIDEEPDQVLLEQTLPRFFEHYGQNLSGDTYVYSGVLEALAALSLAGLQLACVTNKPIEFVQPILNAYQMNQYIQLSVGGGSLPELKPSAAPLVFACEQLGHDLKSDPDKVIMVGDSASDILAANAAGIKSIAVDYGYPQGQDLISLGASAWISSMDELPDLLGINSKH